MAVYGDQLSFFRELFITFNNYSMQPKTVSGFDKRTFICKLTGILQELKGGELRDDGDSLNATEVPTLWTKTKLKSGTFVVPLQGDNKDEIYRITNTTSYKMQGNFYVYVLQLVNGVTDAQEKNTEVNFGFGSYA